MNMMGHLFGMEIHVSPLCTAKEKRFTRKQTRKFTNTRWVKKYIKKYSYEVDVPTVIAFHDKMTIHPEIWKKLKEKYDEGKTSGDVPDSSIRKSKVPFPEHVRPRVSEFPIGPVGFRKLYAQPCS